MAPEKTPDAADVVDQVRKARRVRGPAELTREAARVQRQSQPSEPEPARPRPRIAVRRRFSRPEAEGASG